MTAIKAAAKAPKKVSLTYKAAHKKAQTQRNTAKAARRLNIKPCVSLTRPSDYKNNLTYWQFKGLQAALKSRRAKPVYVSQYDAVGYVPNEIVVASNVIVTALATKRASWVTYLTSVWVNYDTLGIKKHAKKGSTAAKGTGKYVGKQYGVNYPKFGGVVYELWQFFDSELSKGNEVNGKLVKAHCLAHGLNTTTGSCQLFAWRKYQARLNA